MLLSMTAAILLLLTGEALTFTIPSDTPDGLYSVTVDLDGNEVHTPIQDTSAIGKKHVKKARSEAGIYDLASRILPRDSFEVSCGGTLNMNPKDTDDANLELDKQCGDGTVVWAPENFYSIRGEVVAFFCNFSQQDPWGTRGPKYCYASSRQADSRSITDKCGLYNSGWTTVSKGELSWSYGYDSRDSIFCGTGV